MDGIERGGRADYSEPLFVEIEKGLGVFLSKVI